MMQGDKKLTESEENKKMFDVHEENKKKILTH